MNLKELPNLKGYIIYCFENKQKLFIESIRIIPVRIIDEKKSNAKKDIYKNSETQFAPDVFKLTNDIMLSWYFENMDDVKLHMEALDLYNEIIAKKPGNVKKVFYYAKAGDLMRQAIKENT